MAEEKKDTKGAAAVAAQEDKTIEELAKAVDRFAVPDFVTDMIREEILENEEKKPMGKSVREAMDETDLMMKIVDRVMRGPSEKSKTVREVLKVLPEIAKTDNPLVPLILEKVIEGPSSGSDEVDEIKQVVKEIVKTATTLQVARDIVKALRSDEEGSDRYDRMVAMLLQELREKDKKLEELVKELKSSVAPNDVNSVKEEVYNALTEVVSAINASIDELKAQLAAIKQGGGQPAGTNPETFLSELDKWLKIAEKLGAKVMWPKDLSEKLMSIQNVDIEKEIKIKELELKEKELEAKKAFYNSIADAVKTVLTNPDILRSLLGVFTGSPSGANPAPAVPATPPQQAAQVGAPVNLQAPVQTKPKDIPSLDEFLGGEDGQNNEGA